MNLIKVLFPFGFTFTKFVSPALASIFAGAAGQSQGGAKKEGAADPGPAAKLGGAIGGIGGSIVKGIVAAEAEKKRKERERAEQQRAAGRQQQFAGVGNLSRGQQSALSNLVTGFGQAIL